MTARIEQVSAEDANAWITGDDEEVIVIDPGGDPAGVLTYFDSWVAAGPSEWSSWASRGCRGGCTRARRRGFPPGWTARAGTG